MRASGILMHVTSLPGPNGIGAMGKRPTALWIFLSRPGRSTGKSCPSAPQAMGIPPINPFPLLLEITTSLTWSSWWMRAFSAGRRWRRSPGADRRTGWIMAFCMKTGGRFCTKAYERFLGMPNRAFHQFIQRQQDWLQDYALFMALKEEFQGKPWQNGLTVCVCASRRRWLPTGRS